MRNKALATLLLFSSATGAYAQTPEMVPLSRNCTVAAAAEPKMPRLFLIDRKDGDKVARYLQIYGPTKSNGSISEAKVVVDPFEAVVTADALASNSEQNPFIRVSISEGWTALLDRIRKGKQLNIIAGDETISISLAGSGAAVSALERCSR